MSLSERRRARVELEKLVAGRPNFRVHVSKGQIAAALWDYGEDGLAQRALTISDEELSSIQNLCAWYEDPNYPWPLIGQKITHNHVSAFAAITLFEGEVRELARTRRRPQKDRPVEFAPQPPNPSAT